MKDEEDDFISKRDMVEYQTSFTAPEVVKKVRKIREETISVVESSFLKGVEKFFGRPINIGDASGAIEGDIHNLDLDEITRRMKAIERDKNRDPSKNYRYWATINLE